jgi:type VI secretion system protein ImpE
MTAEEAVKAGRLDDALAALQNAIRQAPADAKLRRFLFQLQCVLGNWEKALTQLQILSDMDSESMLLASIFQPVIQCELLRAEVFTGKRSPIVFGEPEHWVGLMVQANSLIGQGEAKAARELQTQALEAAPVSNGTLNNEPFEWIADADSRLGPIMEAMIDGKYCWVPFSRIKKLLIEPPQDLRDLVWTPASFIWTNGGNSAGFIPARYPGSENAGDSALQLSRKTEWKDQGEEIFTGLGQRLFTTDQAEIPLFEVRTVEFGSEPSTSA